jgi:hypothetical protein
MKPIISFEQHTVYKQVPVYQKKDYSEDELVDAFSIGKIA